MKVSTRLEGDLGEVGVEDLFETLRKKCKFADNGVVLRVEKDPEYWDLVVALNLQIRKAQNGGSIVGGTIRAWVQNGLYCDGPGWRMVLVPQEVQVPLTPPGRSGPRLVP